MFYGWIVLIISMVAVAATSPGQSYLIGKFSSAIEADLGISETTLTAAYGLATVLAALPLPLVGRFADRFGPRALMGAAALALGVGCLLMGAVQGPFMLGVGYFVLRLAGQGALGLSASHSTAMWFEQRLGTVMGVKSFAMPLAILTLAPLTTWLIGMTGWRAAFALLGVGVWAAVLPLVLLAHRNRPEDIGQRVDGAPPAPAAGKGQHPHAHADTELLNSAAQVPAQQALDLADDPPEHVGEVCFTRNAAMGTIAFWLIAAAMILNALVGTAFVFLLAKLALAVGLPLSATDSLLSVFAIGAAACAPLAGILTDRLAPRWVVSAGTALLALACITFAVAGNLLTAQLAMIWLAASQTLIFISGGTLLARFFGRPHHGEIRASLAFIMVIGTAVGPFLAAWSAQHLTYAGTLWLFAAAAAPIALSGLALRPPAVVAERGDVTPVCSSGLAG